MKTTKETGHLNLGTSNTKKNETSARSTTEASAGSWLSLPQWILLPITE